MKYLIPAAALAVLAFLGYKLFVAKQAAKGQCTDCAGKSNTPTRAPVTVPVPVNNVLKLDRQISLGMGLKKGMM